MEDYPVKTIEELKEELKDDQKPAQSPSQSLTIGDPRGIRADRAAYQNWWRTACDWLQRREPIPEERASSDEKIEAVVQETLRGLRTASTQDSVIPCKRTFFDTPKGLVAVYEATPNIKVPIFRRRADGHLGAVEE